MAQGRKRRSYVQSWELRCEEIGLGELNPRLIPPLWIALPLSYKPKSGDGGNRTRVRNNFPECVYGHRRCDYLSLLPHYQHQLMQEKQLFISPQLRAGLWLARFDYAWAPPRDRVELTRPRHYLSSSEAGVGVVANYWFEPVDTQLAQLRAATFGWVAPS